MRKLSFFIAILFFFLCNSCTKKDEFRLQVDIDGLKGEKVYLSQRIEGDWIHIDSLFADNQPFMFKGSTEHPDLYYILLKNSNKTIRVFIENSDIKIYGSIDSLDCLQVTGSSEHGKYLSFKRAEEEYTVAFDSLRDEAGKAMDKGNDGRMDEIDIQWNIIQEKKNDFIMDFAQKNNSIVGAFLLYLNKARYSTSELELVLSKYTGISELEYVKALRKNVEKRKQVDIGKEFIDFTMNDVNGKPVTVSELVGNNYLLMEFWSSLCGPCRRENPNIIEIYNDYKNKGFDVLGIAIEPDKDRWLGAIEKDNLPWTQVSDISDWDTEVVKMYCIDFIPHNILLDPEGIIIAKNLYGEELRNTISELLDNN